MSRCIPAIARSCDMNGLESFDAPLELGAALVSSDLCTSCKLLFFGWSGSILSALVSGRKREHAR